MEPAIQRFLAALPDHKRELAMQVRDLMLAASPAITEGIKWRQLTFISGKTNIAFVYTYAGVDYINLGFMQATALSDPKKLFEGTGKGMRHIKIRTAKDIPAAQVRKWVKEALALG
ncbi:MAG: hypothetical protein JWO09_1168 [Bacteroidetes bacterium]|nr:hypothetical protein [Bacteroidota bacterium]